MKQKQPIKPNKLKGMKHEARVGFGLASIPMIGFLVFSALPILLAIVMSFMKIKGFNFNGAEWVGLENYKTLLQDERFFKSIGTTFFEALALPISMVLALIIAVFLNRNVKGTKVYRTILFIPYVCSVVALSTMWKWLYEEEFGILNQFRAVLGLDNIGWISDSAYAPWSMLLTGVWSGMGLGIILYSASIANIPKSYYEAARIDGASSLKQFFKITLPAVSPTTFYLLTIGAINYLQDFTRYQIIFGSDGGPSKSGLTMVFYLWQMAFRYNTTMGMGMASAMSILVALIIGSVVLLLFATQKLWVSYDY